RSVFTRFFGQFTRGKCCSGQPITSRLSTDIKHRVTDTARRTASQLFVSQNSQAKNIHQWIALKAFVEVNLAADGRNTDAIAVMCDSRHHAGEESAVSGDSFLRIQWVGRRSAEP